MWIVSRVSANAPLGREAHYLSRKPSFDGAITEASTFRSSAEKLRLLTTKRRTPASERDRGVADAVGLPIVG